MKENKLKFLYVALILLCLFPIKTVFARNLNIENKGSLTIHKYLNPDIIPIDQGGDGYQGDGTVNMVPGGIPLESVEFSVYGPLSHEDLVNLNYNIDDPDQSLNISEVTKFVKDKDPAFKGTTDRDGTVTWDNIPVDKDALNKNLYLIVETKTPGIDDKGQMIVQALSAPVIVNIPSVNPEKDTDNKEVDHYIYDVNVYMKNYHEDEPAIEKSIDKPTHGRGEEIKYTLTITPLSEHIHEYQELFVTDELHKDVQFSHLGQYPKIKAEESVQFYNGTTDKTIILEENTDYIVVTPGEKQSGTLVWTFTPEGIQKLSGIKEGDGSFIRIYYSAFLAPDAVFNEIIPNDAQLDFVNQWGYGTKPKDDFPKTPPKPSNVVNTIFGDPWFEKYDQSNPDKKLQGAEFLVRNRSKKSIAAYNDYELDPANKLVSYAPETELYAVIKNNQVVGWTPDWREAIRNQWLLVSRPDGKFHVSGLEYTREPIFRKMYIFMVMGVTEVNGTQVEYVDHYEYVLANKRTTTQENVLDGAIQKEIQDIIDMHPPLEDGSGSWKFYKESEADPDRFNLNMKEMIDGFGEQINNYELIEVKAPDTYTPLEKDIKDLDVVSQQDAGTYDNEGNYIPSDNLKSYFKNPLPFTVPGSMELWDTDDINLDQTTVDDDTITGIPNTKKPLMPITGSFMTFILLFIGIVLLISVFVFKRAEN